MPKKCPASYSSTSHKRQRSENKSSNSKKHSHKTVESCHSAKPIQRHRDVVKDQFTGPHPKSAPSSSCSPEILLEINCSPTSTDFPSFPYSCSQKRKASGRQCSAINPTSYCPYYEKGSQLDRSRSSGVRNECCCGVPRKKENSNIGKRVKVKPANDCKPLKDPKPGKPPEESKPKKSRKEPEPHKQFPAEERKICEPEGGAEIFEPELRDESPLRRPCNCCESRVKPGRKKSRNSCSKLLCCSCFKTLWKKQKKKKRKGTSAPCKRYFCLHNPGRSEYEEAIPCVKCTHNCNAKYLGNNNGKELPAGETLVKPSSTNSSSKVQAKSICEVSGPERPDDAFKNGVTKTKGKYENYELEGLPEQRSSTKDHKKREGKCKGENTKKSGKRKPCKDEKKRKKAGQCLPKSSTPVPGTSATKNMCCPCKIQILETDVSPKTKPCMKCPEKTVRGKDESPGKKLTFASCTDLRDYKVENTDSEKKRGAMGLVFDVIFWPYVFWPRRSDPCK